MAYTYKPIISFPNSPPQVIKVAKEYNDKLVLMETAKPEEQAKYVHQLDDLLRTYNNLGGHQVLAPRNDSV